MKILWNKKTRWLVLFLLRFLPVRKNRIISVCWMGIRYNCNPKAITDAIIRRQKNTGISEFDVWYAFEDPSLFKEKLPKEISAVQLGSFEYFKILATSQFVISNIRYSSDKWPFPKKKGQYYIQTMHGGHGIKKIELDVRDELSEEYIRMAQEDTRRTDLMMSDSDYWTHIYRTAFDYQGEVLEKGLPRNDIFFSYKKEESSKKYLIYTPTFRSNGRRDVYGFDVDRVIDALETKFGGEWYIWISAHPNMRCFYKEIYDFSHPRLIDMGEYPELQELLVRADALITDYSSAEMDFSLTKRPQFQLVRDLSDYDRGTYLDPRSLPFPYSENDDELCLNILNFDEKKYLDNLEKFNKEIIGLKETGHAAEAVVDWMVGKSGPLPASPRGGVVKK